MVYALSLNSSCARSETERLLYKGEHSIFSDPEFEFLQHIFRTQKNSHYWLLIRITWGAFKKSQSLDLMPDLLNQNFWGWGPDISSFKSFPR